MKYLIHLWKILEINLEMLSLDSLHPREFIKTTPTIDTKGVVTRPSRTYLVISQNIFHQNTKTCVCLAMIRDTNSTNGFHEKFNARDIELDAGKTFNHNGIIDCSRISAFYKNSIESKLGMKISQNVFNRILGKVRDDMIEVVR